MTTLLTPINGAVLSLLTDTQKHFRKNSEMISKEDKGWRAMAGNYETQSTYPLSLQFTWNSDAAADRFVLSQNPDLSSPIYTAECKNSIEIYNLCIATTYYWQVNGSEVRRLDTEDLAPRWIYADGAFNIRDIGGWKTTDGKRIRQGLLYRGTEMNTHVIIKEEGIRVLRDMLGIKTDLDLRGEAQGLYTESPLGKEVNYRLIPTKAYGDFFPDKATTKILFDILSDQNSYPLYFHCWGGADRTGTLALLTEALLGVSEDDLYLDFELTTLSDNPRTRHEEICKDVMPAIRAYPGETLAKQAENYLLNCGITEKQIETIRTIFLT